MHLDIDTLLFTQTLISGLSAGFLIVAWWFYKETTAALYWAAANLLLGAGVALLAMQTILPAAIGALSIGAFVFADALIWGGARRFDRRPVLLPVVLAGPAVWILALLFAGYLPGDHVGVYISWAATTLYLSAAAWEVWRNSGEKLISRWPVIVLLALRALLFAIYFVDALLGDPINGKPELGTLFAVVNFEHFVFTIGTTVFLIVMMKERHEVQERELANHDSLSGLLTRGAFLQKADGMLAGHRKDDFPLAVLVFDIDKFKAINDTFGHAGGDRVIQTFGAVAHRSVRSGDLVGRIGGEEFAIVLTNASEEVGFAFAERIRNCFRKACGELDGLEFNATVSVGLAVSYRDDRSLSELLGSADMALYRAKAIGRDRTIVATSAAPPDTSPALRIA